MESEDFDLRTWLHEQIDRICDEGEDIGVVERAPDVRVVGEGDGHVIRKIGPKRELIIDYTRGAA